MQHKAENSMLIVAQYSLIAFPSVSFSLNFMISRMCLVLVHHTVETLVVH